MNKYLCDGMKFVCVALLAAAFLTASAPVWAEENADEKLERLVSDVVQRVMTALSEKGEAFANPPEEVTRIITLRNVGVNTIFNLINPMYRGAGLLMEGDADLERIVVKGPQDQVNSFEKMVAQLDVPPPPIKNVELRTYLVLAANEPPSQGRPIPVAFQPAVDELKAIFPFEHYVLLDMSHVRCRDGKSVDIEGALGENVEFEFSAKRISVSDVSVSIDGLHFEMNRKTSYQEDGKTQWRSSRARIMADIDIKPGQTVVVGKSSLRGNDEAIFLALTAQVVELE